MKKTFLLVLVIMPGVVYPVLILGEEPPSCAVLETDKQVYQMGEPVEILFTNDCLTSISIIDEPPWYIADGDNNKVYPDVVLHIVVEVPPGEQKKWVWGQKNTYGKQVPYGVYSVVFHTSEGYYTTAFEIISAPPTCAKVATDKPVYQIGEPVEIQLVNDCLTSINYIDEPPWVIKDSQGEIVFPYFVFFPIIEVPPGEKKTWTWDQKDGDGNQVPEGRYSIELRTDKGIYMTYFDILQSSDCALLETDKPLYQMGEPVEIQFTNNCQVTISLPTDPPWGIIDSDGQVVYPDVVLHVIVEVQPGEKKTWVWDQKNRYRKQVPAGRYTVELTSVGGASYTTSFDILQPSDCALLETDKSVYQIGVPVEILFTNNCQAPMNLPSDPPWVISDSNGRVVSPSLVLPVVVEVQPGQQKTWVWDQKNKDRVPKQVPEGTYTIEITSLEGAYYRTTIEIVELEDCSVLETDKLVYQQGEPVTITFTNNCQTTINLPSDPPMVISDKNVDVVYPDMVLPVMIEVQPGQQKTWVWDQKNNQKVRKQVPVGTYTIEITSLEGAYYRTTIEIVESEDCALLETDKPAYQQGEQVTITFTNNCQIPITFPSDPPWVISNKEGIVSPANVEFVLVEVQPGETKTWVWDQKNKDKVPKQVSEGIYTIELTSVEGVSYRITFEILQFFAPVPGDMVHVNQEEYQPGESIEILFTNDSQEIITFPTDPPWVIKDSQGRIIFSPSAQSIVVEVEPGQQKTWIWNQKDEGGNQVVPGTYTVEFSTTEKTIYTTTFDIKEKEGGFDAWFLLVFSIIVVIFWRFRHAS